MIVVDNYCNSSPESIRRVEKITGKSVKLYELDIKDNAKLAEVFKENKIDAVIHFAGLKAVGESVQKPIMYYRNNIDTTLSLLETMKKYDVNNILFSSSATVYGEDNKVPFSETMPRGACTNPYGWTKSMMEQILEDAAKADDKLSVILLRYFNPIGAHENRSTRERHDRRRPDRNSEQPNALCYAGCSRKARVPYNFWQGLSNKGRHL